MTYLIKDTSGNLVATVNNGVLNTQFDIDLIGQNYVHYGQTFNDNLYKLMENFANNTPPPKGVNGQIWYNKADSNLYINKGSQSSPNWLQIAGGSGTGGGQWTVDYANKRAGWNKFPTFDVDIDANLRTTGSAYINVQDGGQTIVQNGLVLGTVDKSTIPADYSGVISIWSNDGAGNQLQANIALMTDPDPTMRRLSISAVEQNIAWANVTLAEAGGRVGVATTNPTQILDVYGNVAVSGLGRRIIADLDNATDSLRLMFQTVNADSPSELGIIPTGTANNSAYLAYNSSDPDNAGYLSLNGSGQIDSNRTGTGQYQPIIMKTSSVDRVYVGVNGFVGVNTDTPYSLLDVHSFAGDNGITLSIDNNGYAPFLSWKTSNSANPMFSTRYYSGANGSYLSFGPGDENGFTDAFTMTASGNMGINDVNPLTRLSVITKGTGLDGVTVKSDRNHWLKIMPDLPVGSYNPMVQAGDTAIIFGHNAPCPDPGQGLVIAPWSPRAGGIRIDGCGNINISGTFTGAGVQSGKWNFKDTNWSGLDNQYNVLHQGGWEYTGAGEDVTFGIHATGGGSATLNVQGGIRQDYPGKKNWFQDYVGVGTVTPGYMIDIVSTEDYLMSLSNASDNVLGVLLTNKVNYQWEYGMIGPNIVSGTGISNIPANSFYFFDDSQGATRLVITPDGKVGLNTQTPATSMHMYGGDGEFRIEAGPDAAIRLKGYTGFPRSTTIRHHGTDPSTSFIVEASDSADITKLKLLEYRYNDNSWNVYTNNVARLQIATDGGSVFGQAIGGSKGLGNVNAKGYYIDGVPFTGGSNYTPQYPVSSAETWNSISQAGQGTYYWGATDNHHFALYTSSSLRVAYAEASNTANTATSAITANTANTANVANALNPNNNYQVLSLGVGTAASGLTGEIRATNNITAFYSDERLKKDIVLIADPLDKLLKLRGVTYTQNEVAERYGYTDYSQQVGVIAQDVLAVLPEAVKPAPFDIAEDNTSKSGEDYMTVQYEKLVPLLIEAVKELTMKVRELESRLP